MADPIYVQIQCETCERIMTIRAKDVGHLIHCQTCLQEKICRRLKQVGDAFKDKEEPNDSSKDDN